VSERELIERTRTLLNDAVVERVFPAAVAEVGSGERVLWREAFGTLSFHPAARRTNEETTFDLASLTKPIATTSVVLQLVFTHALSLHGAVSANFPEWSGRDREAATIQDLREHAAGLAARLVDAPPAARREFEHDICAMPLEYTPRTRSVYTDLGFILLGFLVEDRGNATLATQFASILERVTARTRGDNGTGSLEFGVAASDLTNSAPTQPLPDDRRRGRMLVGEVHDNYAAALGGIAGHAGLFGTAGAVGSFARAALRGARGDAAIPAPLSPALIALATRKSTVPDSSRALGWDTMLPTSSCGTELSPAAFGHVGFTGTSLWIDPILDRYFVLLTNRVCDGGTSDQLQAVRRRFHDVMAKL
jgi:CubicO group peptidase (beta-lactamase class C family)